VAWWCQVCKVFGRTEELLEYGGCSMPYNTCCSWLGSGVTCANSSWWQAARWCEWMVLYGLRWLVFVVHNNLCVCGAVYDLIRGATGFNTRL
jgi:hypothetical protein